LQIFSHALAVDAFLSSYVGIVVRPAAPLMYTELEPEAEKPAASSATQIIYTPFK
jgi:hypothetical protein